MSPSLWLPTAFTTLLFSVDSNPVEEADSLLPARRVTDSSCPEDASAGGDATGDATGDGNGDAPGDRAISGIISEDIGFSDDGGDSILLELHVLRTAEV